MWFLECVVYAGIMYLNEDFRVEIIKHFVRRWWSPARVKTRSEHDSKWPEDRSMKPWNPRGRKRKMREFVCQVPLSKPPRKWRQGPTWTSVNIQESAGSIVDEDGPEPGQKRHGPTGLGCSGPGSASPLTYTVHGSFIPPAFDDRHIHLSELGET
jgi:hypothetical protein